MLCLLFCLIFINRNSLIFNRYYKNSYGGLESNYFSNFSLIFEPTELLYL